MDIAKILTPHEFVEVFAGLVDEVVVEGEPFWVLRAARNEEVARVIASLALGEAFREEYDHGYLPEPGTDAD